MKIDPDKLKYELAIANAKLATAERERDDLRKQLEGFAWYPDSSPDDARAPKTVIHTATLDALLYRLAKANQKLDDHAEDWAMCGIPHEGQLAKNLVLSDANHKLRDDVAHLREELTEANRLLRTWAPESFRAALGEVAK